MDASLPIEIPGVFRADLTAKVDARGWLVEAWRPELAAIPALQVNVMKSDEGAIRGCHVHRSHADWFFVPKGRALIGLHDVRTRSPSFARTQFLMLDQEYPAGLLVPAGIVHVVFFPVDSYLVTVESERYDPAEELHADWRDPDYGFLWISRRVKSEGAAGGLSRKDLLAAVGPMQEGWWP